MIDAEIQINNLWAYIELLENRIKELENITHHLRPA